MQKTKQPLSQDDNSGDQDAKSSRHAAENARGGAQTEKGDARRRDPSINKNSQAQKDDTRDGQRDQDPHPKKGRDGSVQDGGARQAQQSRSRPPQSIGGPQGQSGKR